MLVKNLSDSLVNRLRGIVTDLNEDSVDVKFKTDLKSFTANLKSSSFTVYDPVDKVILAKRTQLPLKIAFAITIHKSQGLSIEHVVVNCENCSQPGQLGVAVGRATNLEGLQVKNFRKSLCKTHPHSVTSFYHNASVGQLKSDLSCCRQDTIKSSDDNDDDCGGDDSDDCTKQLEMD
jgi:hypothetical protein